MTRKIEVSGEALSMKIPQPEVTECINTHTGQNRR